MKNPAVKFALYALAITAAWTLIEHFLGYNTTNHETGQYTRMAGGFVYWVMIIFAIVALKRQQGGYMSFGQGFKTGAVMSVVFAVGITVWYALYGEVINKQYKPTLMAFERAKLEAAHATPAMIDAQMKQVDMTTGGTASSYLFLFVFMTLGGLVISAITSLIVKKTRKH